MIWKKPSIRIASHKVHGPIIFGRNPIALQQANEQMGGEWRLPSRKELEGLVCSECKPPKINVKYFPGTENEPYWTGQRNWISPKNYWSVNFMTGDTYGRFFPYQKLFVMIVKDK